MDNENRTTEKPKSNGKKRAAMWICLIVLFLCTISAVIIVVFLSPTYVKGNNTSSNGDKIKRNASDMNVIIVGAGISGLTAARNLARAGVNVVLLEGSGRVGGRIQSVPFGGVTINTGAGWIIGKWDNDRLNPLMELTKGLNLSGAYIDEEDYTFRNDKGEDVTQQADDIYDSIFSSVMEKIKEFANTVPPNLDHSMTIRNMLDKLSWWPQTAIEYAMEWWEYDFEFGDLPENCNLRNDLTYSMDQFGSGEFYPTDERGMALIIDELLDQLKQYKQIQLFLNSSVDEIVYTDEKVSVSTKNGTTYMADYVLVTVSIGVLQHRAITFTPPLPPWKLDAIYRTGMSQYTHIFLKFNDSLTPFWEDTEHIIHCSQFRGYHPLIVNFNKDRYFGKKTNILLFTTSQQESVRVEGLSDEEVMAELVAVLHRMYNTSIPDPEGIYISRWSRDPFYYGAYSNWPPSLTLSHYKNLMKPVDKVYFAGEAYDPIYYGYMHSAYMSGEQQAETILNDL